MKKLIMITATLLCILVLLTGCLTEPQAPSYRETEQNPTIEPVIATEATLPK